MDVIAGIVCVCIFSLRIACVYVCARLRMRQRLWHESVLIRSSDKRWPSWVWDWGALWSLVPSTSYSYLPLLVTLVFHRIQHGPEISQLRSNSSTTTSASTTSASVPPSGSLSSINEAKREITLPKRVVTPFFEQVYIFTRRALVQTSREWGTFLFDMGLVLFAGLFFGLIYYQQFYEGPSPAAVVAQVSSLQRVKENIWQEYHCSPTDWKILCIRSALKSC